MLLRLILISFPQAHAPCQRRLRFRCGLLAAVILLLLPCFASAALHGRLPATEGGTDFRAYYDDVTNLTWLVDMNLPWTAEGRHLRWTEATTYGAALNIGGVTGWRLPNVDINGDGIRVQCGPRFPAVTLEECKDNEFEAMIVSNGFWMLGTNGDIGPFINRPPGEDFWTANQGPTDQFGNIYGIFYSPPQVDPGVAPNSYVSLINKKLDQSLNMGSWFVRSGDVLGEVCDNGVDDDGDGLVDVDDPDCVPPLVRCYHDPVYTAGGVGDITITASAMDRLGKPLVADEIEIWLDTDPVNPQHLESDTSSISLEISPAGSFSYGCLARNGARTHFSGWRTVDIGDPDFPAIAILLNGPLDEKIDVVFLADQDEYAAFSDPNFVEDVGLLISEGYFTVPELVEAQDSFNFWIAKDFGDSGPDPEPDAEFCLRQGPDNWNSAYAFADVGAIVHRTDCRDRASAKLRLFSIEMDFDRLQVVAHETSHAPFGLADEYCCKTRYYSNPPFANLLDTEADCEAEAVVRGFEPSNCRLLQSTTNTTSAWIFEPDYDSASPQPRDLMQTAGCASFFSRVECLFTIPPDIVGPDLNPNGLYACDSLMSVYAGDPDGTPESGDEKYWLCRTRGAVLDAVWVSSKGWLDRFGVGPSELDRFYWFLTQCAGGKC